MGKRTLICEGGSDFSIALKATYNNFTLVSSTCDLVYHIFYTDTVFDTIIVGNDFEVDFKISEINELSEILEEFNLTSDNKFFAIELGKLCKELSSKKCKKEPKIVIFSPYDIKEDVKKNNMVFLSKNDDFFEELCMYLE